MVGAIVGLLIFLVLLTSPYGRRLLAVVTCVAAVGLLAVFGVARWQANTQAQQVAAEDATIAQTSAPIGAPPPATLMLAPTVTAPVARPAPPTAFAPRAPVDLEARMRAVLATGLAREVGGVIVYCTRNRTAPTDGLPAPEDLTPCPSEIPTETASSVPDVPSTPLVPASADHSLAATSLASR
jgi:hypothetical protein